MLGIVLTVVVGGGKEAIVFELLAQAVHRDAELGQRGFHGQHVVAEALSLSYQNLQLVGEGLFITLLVCGSLGWVDLGLLAGLSLI